VTWRLFKVYKQTTQSAMSTNCLISISSSTQLLLLLSHHTAACVCVCARARVCVTEQVAGDELSPQCLDLRVGRLLTHSKVQHSSASISNTSYRAAADRWAQPVVKVVLWSRGAAHLTKPGWSKPHTHSNPTNLALFRHKITLYRFNHGASYYCKGAQMGAGGLRAPSL